MRIKLCIEYDGKAFSGWQVQPNAYTIQGVLEDAIATYLRVDRSEVILHGSGRTDAGVHAQAQIAHLDIPNKLTPDLGRLREGLNGITPTEVSVISIEETDKDFHSRYSAQSKTYCYSLLLREAPPSLQFGRVWHIKRPIDIDRLKDCAGMFLGKHDFKRFCAADCTTKTSVREIFYSSVGIDGDLCRYHVTGSGFLKHQVRFMVGAMIAYADGSLERSIITELLSDFEKDFLQVPFIVAPAHGLCLEEVLYTADFT